MTDVISAKVLSLLTRLRTESGQGAVEYALLVGVVAAVIGALSLTTFKTDIQNLFDAAIP